MPTINVNDTLIHYELDGRGEEVLVILNGIMMSTVSWTEHVPYFTRNGLRVLRMDFRDQGQSGKAQKPYTIHQHAEDLKALLAALGIDRVHLHGISYGGQAALLFALKYPENLKSLMIVNALARKTRNLMKIGDLWEEAARLKDGRRFFRLVVPTIYSSFFIESHWDWLKEREEAFSQLLTEEWFDSYLRLADSLGDYDILEDLGKITVPTLVMASDRDLVTPMEELRALRDGIPNSRFLIIPDCGHGACYEKVEEYCLGLLGFIALLKGGVPQ